MDGRPGDRLVAAATAASGTTQGGLVIVNGSNEQDGGLPTALVTQKTANYNYHQIIRNAYTFTNTAQWSDWYSGNPLTYHRKKIAVEHKRELENGLFFGARSYTAGTSTPRATFGGLDEFISTNITDAGGTFDKGELQDFLRAALSTATRRRRCCSPRRSSRRSCRSSCRTTGSTQAPTTTCSASRSTS
jgi:hypothetical protein